METNLLSTVQVARRLGVTPTTVYRWCVAGKMPAVKVGQVFVIREEDARLPHGLLGKVGRPAKKYRKVSLTDHIGAA